MNKLSCKVKAKLRKEGWTVSDGTQPQIPGHIYVETVLRNRVNHFLRGDPNIEFASVRGWRWDFLDGPSGAYDVIAWRIRDE